MTVPIERLRNFGIVAHIDAGKTTVSERILFYSGREHRMGEVHEGTAVMDWMPEEQERGITITAAATYVPWRDCELQLIDTPGHVDFTAEVERSMRVLDGCVVVFCGVAGVQAQSETVWRQADKFRVPRLVFVNKLDRPGADFERVVSDIEKRLRARVVPLQWPIGQEKEFSGVVDLVRLKAWRWDEDDQGAHPIEIPLPEQLETEIEIARGRLLEAAAEADESLLERYLEGAELPNDEIVAGLRKATISGAIVPVLCGSALRNRGIQPLLDAVVDYLPSPIEVPPVEAMVIGGKKDGETVRIEPDPEMPFCGLVFKIATDKHGDLSFVRVYAGSLRSSDQLYNSREKKVERVGQILRMHANAREQIESAGAGAIIALPGLRYTRTGDTLYEKSRPVSLESLTFPEPVISMTVEPVSSGDRDKLLDVLKRLEREDPTFRSSENEETGELLMSGMGELHLEVLRNRISRDFRVEVRSGKPRVAYRETVSRPAARESVVERALGNRNVHGHVRLRVVPAAEVARVEVLWMAPAEQIPRVHQQAIVDALKAEASSGPICSYPVVNVRIAVEGGSVREGESHEGAYCQAAIQALREALQEAGPVLLEPIMRFEVQSPADYLGSIQGDLNSRRAVIQDMVVEGDLRILKGTVPIGEMFGYSTAVRSLSQGRASFGMEPDRYSPVPADRMPNLGY
ncbi:MAG: elongation factor G [Planctomycetes bacterium]|nr:elongation factor G [Planctomycetota bacterium]